MIYLFTPQPAGQLSVSTISTYVISERFRRMILGRVVRRAKGWEFCPRRGAVLTAHDLGTVSRFMRELA
jgi:hypothetical protein